MDTNKNIENSIKVVLSILLLGCLLNWAYGYFQFVRFVGMISFGFLAYKAYERNNTEFSILWAASAILINPLIKISLGRELWNIIDVLWAVLLVGSIFYAKKSKSEIEKSAP